MGHHCACPPSKRESDRSVSTEASNGVVTLAAVGRLLPSNQRLERTGARLARFGRSSVGAGRSTAGRYTPGERRNAARFQSNEGGRDMTLQRMDNILIV